VIQLEHLHIVEFRGIRSIDLALGSKSFVVHGPNGSGKSGVVDAIDFVLSGSIRRLSGEGAGAVSVQQHAPHVLVRDNPNLSKVVLTFRDVASGQIGSATRSVSSRTQVTITPNTAELQAAFAQAIAHPELTLSRREIIKYVVSPPATRSQQVQDLLRLERVGEFRKLLNAAKTKLTASARQAKSDTETARGAFKTQLAIANLTDDVVLAAINRRREILGATPLAELEGDTDILAAITAGSGTTTFNLISAKANAADLTARVVDKTDIDEMRSALTAKLDELLDDASLASAMKHESLLRTGFAAIETNSCPLCGLEWADVETLKAHVQAELARADSARTFREALTVAADNFAAELTELRESIDQVVPISESRGAEQLPTLLRQWSTSIVSHIATLQTADTILASASAYTEGAYAPPAALRQLLDELAETLGTLPDQTALVDARTYLSLAKDGLGRVRALATLELAAAKALEAGTAIATAYVAASDDALNALYRSVESDFSRYYQFLNSDDEGSFAARLTPTSGSLDLAVDFYGIDMFPPNAYHSEGHQDGMGVCLYLALIKHLLGDDFRLAVLDDVVMSVDVNHRRQFCELLKAEFPNVQFIITTHDEVWTRQMRSAGIGAGKQHARFYGWTVADGPLYDQGDVWARIEEDLAAGDVNGAAHKLRRHMEASTADIAEKIGGRVAFHGNAQYDLSDFMDAVNGRLKDVLALASESANSFDDDSAKAVVQAKKATRSTVVSEEAADRWAVNLLVHQNDWAQMSETDFRPVLKSAKDFLDLYECDNPACGSWIHVIGRPPEVLKCDCGRYALNLVKKPRV
jgi:RecF/RecN/SMC N terminal domain